MKQIPILVLSLLMTIFISCDSETKLTPNSKLIVELGFDQKEVPLWNWKIEPTQEIPYHIYGASGSLNSIAIADLRLLLSSKKHLTNIHLVIEEIGDELTIKGDVTSAIDYKIELLGTSKNENDNRFIEINVGNNKIDYKCELFYTYDRNE